MKTLLMVLCLTATTFGGLLTDLSFNNNADTLQDEGVGLIQDRNGNGSIDAGDVVQGAVRIASIIPDGQGGIPQNSLYGVYSYQVGGVVGSRLDMVPATGSDSIGSVLGAAGFSTAGLTNTTGAIGDASLAFVETVGAVPLADLDAPGGSLVSGGAIGGVISSGNGWQISLITGQTGDDFFNILLHDPTYTNLSTLASLDPNTVYSQYRTAQSVLYHGFGFPASFVQLNVDADYTTGVDSRAGDFISSGNNLFSNPSSIAAAGGWGASTDGNFRMAAHAPEPGSLLIVGIAGLMSLLRRRR